jgi:non-specific serine/threonine protein kinase
LRLTSALSRYWSTRGFVSEGRRWTTRALDIAPEAPEELRATALNRCAILARMEGDNRCAGVLWEESLVLFRTLGDAAGIARIVGNLGLLYYDLGDDVQAHRAMTESLALRRQQGNQQAIAEALLNLGMVYARQHRHADAEEAYTEAGAIFEASGDQTGMAFIYLHMADLAREGRQLDRAAHLYTTSLRLSLALGNRPQLASAIEGMARLLLRRYESDLQAWTLPRLSTELFACAAAVRESTGAKVEAGNLHMHKATLDGLRASLGTTAFEAAWGVGWDTPVLTLIERIPE